MTKQVCGCPCMDLEKSTKRCMHCKFIKTVSSFIPIYLLIHWRKDMSAAVLRDVPVCPVEFMYQIVGPEFPGNAQEKNQIEIIRVSKLTREQCFQAQSKGRDCTVCLLPSGVCVH